MPSQAKPEGGSNDPPDRSPAQEADEILRLVQEAGYAADQFKPGETLEEFLRRHGLDIE